LTGLDALARLGHAPHDLERVRTRVTQALQERPSVFWGVSGAEGLYTGFVANMDSRPVPSTRRRSAASTPDDTIRLEYEFARSVGKAGHSASMTCERLRRPASTTDLEGVSWIGPSSRTSVACCHAENHQRKSSCDDAALRQRLLSRQSYANGNLKQPGSSAGASDAEGTDGCHLAGRGAGRCGDLRGWSTPSSCVAHGRRGEAVLGRLDYRNGQVVAAVDHLVTALRRYRDYPWRPVLYSRASTDIDHRRGASGLRGADFRRYERAVRVRALDDAGY